jgi:hypothetical protein
MLSALRRLQKKELADRIIAFSLNHSGAIAAQSTQSAFFIPSQRVRPPNHDHDHAASAMMTLLTRGLKYEPRTGNNCQVTFPMPWKTDASLPTICPLPHSEKFKEP